MESNPNNIEEKKEENTSSNWGFYLLVIGSAVIFVAMIVSAYIDHHS